MKLAIAGDSAGEPLALALYDYLKDREGFTVDELSHPVDGAEEFYANMSARVCQGVVDGTYDRAIVICGTGIGVSIAANKVPGIRAAHVHDAYSAAKASTSNNAQVITMGARVVGTELAKTIVDAWLATSFDENGPSADNVKALDQVDAEYSCAQFDHSPWPYIRVYRPTTYMLHVTSRVLDLGNNRILHSKRLFTH